jgi:dethiobiotin synthetase
MSAFFVTSSGTDIGKTFVTAGLLRTYQNQNRIAHAVKPVLSGFDPANIQESDTGILLAAVKQDATMENVKAITPWRFAAPLAPDMAARREGPSLDFKAVVDFSRRAIDDNSTLFIEGVGGVMAPLTETHTVMDWIEALGVPTLLVVGSYLGAISHTLTALKTVQSHGFQVAAIVVSESVGSTVPLEDTLSSISRFAGKVPCLALPRGPETHPPAFENLIEILDAT